MILRCRCGEVVGQHEAYPGAGVEDVYALCPVHEPEDDWTGGNDGYLFDLEREVWERDAYDAACGITLPDDWDIRAN